MLDCLQCFFDEATLGLLKLPESVEQKDGEKNIDIPVTLSSLIEKRRRDKMSSDCSLLRVSFPPRKRGQIKNA